MSIIFAMVHNTTTLAHPVMIRDQFIGVIATDILVSALEKILMPKLKEY